MMTTMMVKLRMMEMIEMTVMEGWTTIKGPQLSSVAFRSLSLDLKCDIQSNFEFELPFETMIIKTIERPIKPIKPIKRINHIINCKFTETLR